MYLIVLSIFTIIICGHLWVKQRFLYWEKRRIPYLKPNSLIYGNEYESIRGKISLPEGAAKHYNDLAPHRFGGTYHFYKPIFYVRDPELIRNILIKDFHHFHDHVLDLASKDDPLSLVLFNLNGEEWKTLRQKLTPTFSSGKMKLMFELMKECVEKMNSIIVESIPDDESLNVKDLMTR